MSVRNRATSFLLEVQRLQQSQNAALRSKAALEKQINTLMHKSAGDKKALDIATGALAVLRELSDETVKEAYSFLKNNINSALAEMFARTERRIELREYTRGNYPQLEVHLNVGGGQKRSLKDGSGTGIAQIVSLLSVLVLTVITGSRRLLVLDEVLYGVDKNNLKIVEDILWAFVEEYDFQFVLGTHGFIPQGARVYELEIVGKSTSIKDTRIQEKGVYLELQAQ